MIDTSNTTDILLHAGTIVRSESLTAHTALVLANATASIDAEEVDEDSFQELLAVTDAVEAAVVNTAETELAELVAVREAEEASIRQLTNGTLNHTISVNTTTRVFVASTQDAGSSAVLTTDIVTMHSPPLETPTTFSVMARRTVIDATENIIAPSVHITRNGEASSILSKRLSATVNLRGNPHIEANLGKKLQLQQPVIDARKNKAYIAGFRNGASVQTPVKTSVYSKQRITDRWLNSDARSRVVAGKFVFSTGHLTGFVPVVTPQPDCASQTEVSMRVSASSTRNAEEIAIPFHTDEDYRIYSLEFQGSASLFLSEAPTLDVTTLTEGTTSTVTGQTFDYVYTGTSLTLDATILMAMSGARVYYTCESTIDDSSAYADTSLPVEKAVVCDLDQDGDDELYIVQSTSIIKVTMTACNETTSETFGLTTANIDSLHCVNFVSSDTQLGVLNTDSGNKYLQLFSSDGTSLWSPGNSPPGALMGSGQRLFTGDAKNLVFQTANGAYTAYSATDTQPVSAGFLTLATEEIVDIAITDFLNDGSEQIALLIDTASVISLEFREMTGGLITSTLTDLSLTDYSPFSKILARDMNNDGDMDLVVYNPEITILYNQGCDRPNCTLGSYWSGVNEMCHTCAPGEYNDDPEATSCTDCALGRYSGAEAATCTACPVGEFANTTGQSECHLCPAGSSAKFEESSSCDTCPAGRYQSSPGQDACNLCPDGSYQDEEGSTTCILCPAGTASLSGATECITCTPGTFSPTEGSDACGQCGPGTYASGNGSTECTECSPGYYAADSQSTECTPCPAGKYTAENATVACGDCSPGFFQNDTGSTACLACNPANLEYQPSAGATRCHTCSIGTYVNAVRCDAATHVDISAVYDSQCPSGKADIITPTSDCEHIVCSNGSVAALTITEGISCHNAQSLTGICNDEGECKVHTRSTQQTIVDGGKIRGTCSIWEVDTLSITRLECVWFGTDCNVQFEFSVNDTETGEDTREPMQYTTSRGNLQFYALMRDAKDFHTIDMSAACPVTNAGLAVGHATTVSNITLFMDMRGGSGDRVVVNNDTSRTIWVNADFMSVYGQVEIVQDAYQNLPQAMLLLRKTPADDLALPGDYECTEELNTTGICASFYLPSRNVLRTYTIKYAVPPTLIGHPLYLYIVVPVDNVPTPVLLRGPTPVAFTPPMTYYIQGECLGNVVSYMPGTLYVKMNPGVFTQAIIDGVVTDDPSLVQAIHAQDELGRPIQRVTWKHIVPDQEAIAIIVDGDHAYSPPGTYASREEYVTVGNHTVYAPTAQINVKMDVCAYTGTPGELNKVLLVIFCSVATLASLLFM